jgi:hypothetical protein
MKGPAMVNQHWNGAPIGSKVKPRRPPRTVVKTVATYKYGQAHRKFEDGYILLNGAAADADACDQLALAGKRRSTAQVWLLDDGR